MTLAEALNANKGIGPGFHFVRHFLSAAILLVHCRLAIYGLAGHDAIGAAKAVAIAVEAAHPANPSLLNDLLRPGLFALIAAFFALSGFLVTGSAVRTGKVRVFLTNRALRIFPALGVEVTLSAVLLGAAVTTLPLADYYGHPQFDRYFGNIVGHITFFLPGVFEDLPYPAVVNGNLWTLQPEFWCYAVMALVMAVGVLRRPRLLALAAMAMIAGATLLDALVPAYRLVLPQGGMFPPYYVTVMFFIGVAFFFYADRVPLKFWMFAVSVIAFHLSVMFRILPAFSGIFLTYGMLYVGMQRFDWFERVMKSDFSYGIYLYGFPIMQTIVHCMTPYMTGWSNIAKLAVLIPATFATTIAFAALSWRLIEKPALRLRRLFMPPQSVIPPAAAA